MRFTEKEAIERGWITATPRPLPLALKQNGVSASDLKSVSRPKRNDWEGDEQANLIKQVTLRFPDDAPFLIHIPNGGSRANRFEGYRLKRQGTRRGVSDLLLARARGGFHGLWIEFKASPPHSAPLTCEQMEWIDLMRMEGYQAQCCRGADEAITVISEYLALP